MLAEYELPASANTFIADSFAGTERISSTVTITNPDGSIREAKTYQPQAFNYALPQVSFTAYVTNDPRITSFAIKDAGKVTFFPKQSKK
jgi:hypothetical protein